MMLDVSGSRSGKSQCAHLAVRRTVHGARFPNMVKPVFCAALVRLRRLPTGLGLISNIFKKGQQFSVQNECKRNDRVLTNYWSRGASK